MHLDGARLWHAAAALGVPIKELAAGVDTVNVCLSKGLGAPFGSVLCGSAATITAARRLRKMLGGGVRQGGVAAAAGLVALEYLPQLPRDHAKALRIARAVQAVGFAIPDPQTNILLIPVSDVKAAASALAAKGVLVRVRTTCSCFEILTYPCRYRRLAAVSALLRTATWTMLLRTALRLCWPRCCRSTVPHRPLRKLRSLCLSF